MGLNPTAIEWVISRDGSKGYTWNPIVGCKNNCWYCYARELATTRFAEMPGKCEKCGTFEPHFHPERLKIPGGKPKTIFFGSMCDAWGSWVPAGWIEKCLAAMYAHPEHTFLTLTKNQRGYMNHTLDGNRSLYRVENLWTGQTRTDDEPDDFHMMTEPFARLNPRKFLSLEPLLEDVSHKKSQVRYFLEWGSDYWRGIIIGPLNKAGHDPITKREWVERIIDIAQAAGVPIFMKDAFRTKKCADAGVGYTKDEMIERNLRQLPWEV